MIVAFVGGTGPAGVGLAARLGRAGVLVAVGSRSPERAAAAREQVLALAPGATVAAGVNEEVVRDAEVVFLTVPPPAQRETVERLAGALAGRIVVSMANPVRVEQGRVLLEPPPEGSMAEEAAALAPGARVVGAFHEIHVGRFARVERPIDADTIVCADDEGAKRVVIDLASRIEGVRPVDGGALANSRHVEAFVAVLVTINLRYRARTSLRISGLPE